MDNQSKLHWLDYIVFIGLLSTTIAIGLYFALSGKRQRTIAEYFTGNRNLSFVPTIISYIVSFRAAGIIVALPVETYYFGGHFLISVTFLIGVYAAAQLVVPVIYPLKLISINGYLELRWKSKYVKQACSALIVVRSILFLGLVIYSSSIVISVIANWSLTTVITVTSVVSIVFTMLGGIKAVIWTDVILCVCMLSGVILILTKALVNVGGLREAWRLALAGGRLDIFDFRLDPTLRFPFWTVLISSNIDHSCAHSFTQASVQRYSNVNTLTKAKYTMMFSALGEALFVTLGLSIGFVLYAYYASIECDPLKSGAIASPNLLVPYFVLENLDYPGVLGFFSASVVAASVSTFSSFLNSSAAILWDDFGRHLKPDVSTQRATTISKYIVLVLGVISMLFGIVVQYLGGTIVQMFKSAATLAIPVYGVYLASIFWPWFNKKGLLSGGIISFVLVTWLCLGQFYSGSINHAMLPTSTEQCIMGENSSMISSNAAIYTTTTITNITNTNAEIYDGNLDNDINHGNFGKDSDQETHAHQGNNWPSDVLVWIYSISFFWYSPLGLLIFFIVGSTVSLCTGREKLCNIDERLLVAWYKRKAKGTCKEMEALNKSEG